MAFGVNPNEASNAGNQAATEANAFAKVADDFSEILSDCRTAAGDTGAGPGFVEFNGDWKKAMLEVERHGRQTGLNTSDVSGRSTLLDLDLYRDFETGTKSVPKVGDIIRTIN